MTGPSDNPPALRDFPKTSDFFVGIDSDGCAFDTMEVKHKECFIPNIVKVYGLAAVSRFARECAEFVNLYSRHRGVNRFPGLVLTLDLLADRSEVKRRGFEVPRLPGLRRWVQSGAQMSNPGLKEAISALDSGDLSTAFRSLQEDARLIDEFLGDFDTALQWSLEVNKSIDAIVRGVPPFPFVRESLQSLQGKADVMVVSATPGEALAREWQEHDIARYVSLIAGQELGGKRDLLANATAGRYEKDRVLMVGDAPGDHRAAAENGFLFYPIEPGREDESWRRFHDEALPRFFEGRYAGTYAAERVAAFEALLPTEPPWK